MSRAAFVRASVESVLAERRRRKELKQVVDSYRASPQEDFTVSKETLRAAGVMQRGEIRYADVEGSFSRRPVIIVSATEIIPVLSAVTCAPLTTSIRGIPTRVALGPEEGLREPSEAVCDALVTLHKSDIDTAPTGSLGEDRIRELDRAIARALDIRRANLPPA